MKTSQLSHSFGPIVRVQRCGENDLVLLRKTIPYAIWQLTDVPICCLSQLTTASLISLPKQMGLMSNENHRKSYC